MYLSSPESKQSIFSSFSMRTSVWVIQCYYAKFNIYEVEIDRTIITRAIIVVKARV